MTVKLTKNELRLQQIRLTQLKHYLPTLQLKKSLLQYEVNHTIFDLNALKEDFTALKSKIEPFSVFLLDRTAINLNAYLDVQHLHKRYENIAGIEIPIFEKVLFRDVEYSLFDTPEWTESAISLFRSLITLREKIHIFQEKLRALENELREVSIRVNLFEKILIPRSIESIRKIRIFLADQQLTAVAQAKVAKSKIMARRK